MSATPPNPNSPPNAPAPARESSVGLRLRLWLVCVAGGAIAGLGSLWVLGTRVRPGTSDPAELLAWLAGVAFASAFSGLLLALWLDHHIVGHLRGLLRGLHTGRVAELRGLSSATGWGELSELADVAQDLLANQRRSARAVEELDSVRGQLGALQLAVDQWLRTESWDAPDVGSGQLTSIADGLARGFARRGAVDEQNSQVARQVATELSAALGDAQESAEQAERGFVEATAMLTTVRELQRLSLELQAALGVLGGPIASAHAGETDVRGALDELVVASQASIDSIGRGMLRVQDVSELVQQLANRATLIAIHAVTAARQEDGGPAQDVADELRLLVQDVREATDRATQFALEIESAVGEASERMHAARELAATRLGAPATVVTTPDARAWDDAQRLLERVREMVQDAARKGERLSAAGERASRAAERLSRRVNEESTETQALVVRLTPVGPAGSRELRLLASESPAMPDAPAAPGATGLPAALDASGESDAEPRREDRP